MDQRRAARVGEAIREELSQILSFEMSDPRLRGLSIDSVRVTPDGREAHIDVALFGEASGRGEAMAGLEHAKGHLRHEIGARMKLRHVPELFFSASGGVEASARVEHLLSRVRRNRRDSE